MVKMLHRWLGRKWQVREGTDLLQAYHVTFSSVQGQIVLLHLLDHVYCTTYDGDNAMELAKHNGRRQVIQEILQNLDLAEHPSKYEVTPAREETYARG